MEPATLPIGKQTIDLSAASFWDAVADGRLIIQKCSECGELRYPPHPHCPACWSDGFEEIEASGRGEIYTFIVYERAFKPELKESIPYVAALVQLEEGPKMWTNLVDYDDEDGIQIGAKVSFHFESDGERSVPRCRLA